MAGWWIFGGGSAANDEAQAELATLREEIANLQTEVAERDKQIERLKRFKTNQGVQMGKLGERLALSESIVHGLPEPLLVVDTDGVITYLNAACAVAAGVSEDAVDGKLREADVWQHEPGEDSALELCLARVEAVTGVEYALTGQDGRQHRMLVSAAPRLTAMGDCRGAFVLYRDITERSQLVDRLVGASARMHDSAAEMLTTSREQMTTANEQAATVAQVSTTSAELAGSAAEVADACASIAAATAELAHTARQGGELLERSLTSLKSLRETSDEAGRQISDLGERTRRIEGIVDLIGKVAAETKLIAFNAAIEAARAGDAGRGFSVVASEVKGLAENVAASSTEIKTMVGDIRASTSQSILTAEGQAKLMEQLADHSQRSAVAFEEIITAIDTIAQRAGEISSASEQQKTATSQLTLSVQEVSNAASLSAASARDAIGSVSTLTEFANELGGALASFRGDDAAGG